MQDSIVKKREDLPSESVLSSRLKKLMEALRDAASKQQPGMAALAESSHRLSPCPILATCNPRSKELSNVLCILNDH